MTGINIKSILTPQRFIGNILWRIFSIVIGLIFVSWLRKRIIVTRYKAYKIAKQLIRYNRPAIGIPGHPKFLADRFIQIRYDKSNTGLTYIKRGRYGTPGIGCFNHEITSQWNNMSDDDLIKLGLIRIDNSISINYNGTQYVKPIINKINKLVVKIIERRLVKRLGDNPDYYKNLRKHADINKE